MARAGRQQRRAARRAEQREETQQGKKQPKQQAKQPKAASRRSRQAQVRPGATPPKQQTGRREAAPRARFVRESWGELKKVEWPGRNQVMQGTVVVLIACAIVGAYLWVADMAFSRLVENVILRGV